MGNTLSKQITLKEGRFKPKNDTFKCNYVNEPKPNELCSFGKPLTRAYLRDVRLWRMRFGMSDIPAPFWRTKSLEAMSSKEWESLCDGCGRCCLLKLEDEDDGTLYHTDVACRLFDGTNCQCRDYANRASKVPDCVTLTPEQVRTLRWLPPTCGYRLVAEGKDLAWWHPLMSGTSQTVIDAGISVSGRVFATEDEVSLAKLQTRIRKWPNTTPKSSNTPVNNR